MAAPKGNQFYKLVTHWKEKDYRPDQLWNKAVEYLTWCTDNPLKEEMVFGTGFRTNVAKMRAPTLEGFYLFCHTSQKTFQNYEKDEDYLVIITRVRHLLRVAKIEGAAAGLLNANIIARELGLSDSSNVKVEDTRTEIKALFPTLNELQQDNQS